jgi:DNA-binding NarL/FixJ family response regulator
LSRPRVLLADDHAPLLEAATALLASHYDTVGTASDGETLVQEALRLRPEIVVTDITMRGMSGIDAIRRLREQGFLPRVVILTIHEEEEFLKACVAEGALGYVIKSQMKSHLIPAVEAALAGRQYISPMGPAEHTQGKSV